MNVLPATEWPAWVLVWFYLGIGARIETVRWESDVLTRRVLGDPRAYREYPGVRLLMAAIWPARIFLDVPIFLSHLFFFSKEAS